MNDWEEVGMAIDLARLAHGDQPYGEGTHFGVHLCGVANSVHRYGPKYITTAFLHDVVEDTPVQLSELRSAFDDLVVDAVDLLTRRAGVPYENYIEELCQHGDFLALTIKQADLRFNISRAEGRWKPLVAERWGPALLLVNRELADRKRASWTSPGGPRQPRSSRSSSGA